MYQSLKALDYALNIHTGKRKDGQPEVSHQFEIVGFLTQILSSRMSLSQMDATIASAFLHDVIEDYPEQFNFEDLKNEFEEGIYDIVFAVSKPPGFDKYNKKQMDSYFGEILKIPEAVIVKGVDRIHNMQTMSEGLSMERQKEYVIEVEEYFYPLFKHARKKYPQFYFIYITLSQTLERQIYFLNKLHEQSL